MHILYSLSRKKDGAMRLCIDFCNLNANAHVDWYPILCIDDLLDCLPGACVFLKIDLLAGYHQV